MNDDLICRKEVHLSRQTIKVLAALATKDKRALKNYMEKVLQDHSTLHEPYLKKRTTKTNVKQ